MRNKYRKLFIEIEPNGESGYQVKEKYRQPLFDYVKSGSYKDVIVKLYSNYLNATSQILSNGSGYIRFGNVLYEEDSVSTYTTGEINVDLENESINVIYSEL